MRAGTHIIAGVMVAYALGGSAELTPIQIGALGALGGLVALLPDIDHPNSAIRAKTGLLGTLAAFWMTHRGITHTLPAVLVVWALAALLSSPLVALVCAAAYASHLVLDACTPSGVMLLWPLSNRRLHLLPRALWIRTGSFRERGVALALGAVLVWSAWPAQF